MTRSERMRAEGRVDVDSVLNPLNPREESSVAQKAA